MKLKIQDKFKESFTKINTPYNMMLIALIIIYVSFISFWEDLFNKVLVNPLLSRFESTYITTGIFAAFVTLLIIKGAINFKKKSKSDISAIILYLTILSLWAYYRFISNRYELFHIEYCPYIYYFDIVGFYAIYKTYCFFIPLKNKPVFKNGFYIDKPIEHSHDDILGRTVFAEDLVNKLLSTDTTNESFTLGITAKWGDGKTSFMTLMREFIVDYYKDCIVLEFNPWRYSDKANLTHAFFIELSKTLSPINHSLANDIQVYSEILSNIDIPSTKIAKAISHSFAKTSINDQNNKIANSLKELRRKIVVFIDDIDRLTNEELIEVVKLIRNSSNFPYIYFIVSYDKEYLQKSLLKVFPSCSNDFDDKLFQKEFALPAIPNRKISDYILSCVKDISDKDDYESLETHISSRQIVQNVDMSFIKNFRDVKRLMNNFIPIYQRLYKEINPIDLLNLEIFKLKYLNIYQIFEQNRKSILRKYNGAYVLYTQERFKKDPRDYDNAKNLDFLAYLKNEKESLGLTDLDIESISGILESLFHNLGISHEKSINNVNYTDRYFYQNILESDISIKEFNIIIKKPIDEIKTVFSKWATNKSFSLTTLLYELKAVNKEALEKQIILMFYVGSISQGWHNDFKEIDEKIDGIRKLNDKWQYTNEDLEFIENTLLENGANTFIENYLSNINYIPTSWSYPLSKDKINEIRVLIFKDGLHRYASYPGKLIRCFYGTSDLNYISQGNNTYTKETIHQQEKITLMKDYIKNNIDNVISSFLSYYVPNDDKRYCLTNLPLDIWGDWDEFEKFIFSISEPSDALKEFQTFFLEYKQSKYSEYIPFHFKHIILND